LERPAQRQLGGFGGFSFREIAADLLNAYGDRRVATGGHIPSTVWWVILTGLN
jgi:hypothetical protein